MIFRLTCNFKKNSFNKKKSAQLTDFWNLQKLNQSRNPDSFTLFGI